MGHTQKKAEANPLEELTRGPSGASPASNSSHLDLNPSSSSRHANLGRIEEAKRNKLKSVLTSCIAKGWEKDVAPDTRLNRIVQNLEDHRLECMKKNVDGFTLDQANPEINQRDPDEFGSTSSSSRVEDSSLTKATANDFNIANQKFQEPAVQEKDQHEDCPRIKQEPTKLVSNILCSGVQEMTKNSEELQTVSDLFVTPKKSKFQRNGKRVATGSLKKSRRSIMQNESCNHKITDYFPVTSKHRTSAEKSKRENVEPAFILSALKGDPNLCIFCNENFNSNYIKEHLVDQHGIDKESIRSRPVKREIGVEELHIDAVK